MEHGLSPARVFSKLGDTAPELFAGLYFQLGGKGKQAVVEHRADISADNKEPYNNLVIKAPSIAAMYAAANEQTNKVFKLLDAVRSGERKPPSQFEDAEQREAVSLLLHAWHRAMVR